MNVNLMLIKELFSYLSGALLSQLGLRVELGEKFVNF